MIYGLDGHGCKDHHGSEHVQYEPDDRGYRIICDHDDRDYVSGDHDYASGDRDYASYDLGYVNDDHGYANDDHGYANGDHDYDLCIENEAFRFFIQDCAPNILHAKDARALHSSLQLADVNDENASNYDDLPHARRYEESA